MKKQPDFRALFYEYYGDRPQKITYRIRPDSNRHHDMVFLNSFVHDARFRRSEIAVRGKHVTIPMIRDCWELGHVGEPDCVELYVARARLSISPVECIEWHFLHNTECYENEELWIESVEVQCLRSASEHDVIVSINGHGWRCSLTANNLNLRIRLQDLEVPYLYSEKKRHK